MTAKERRAIVVECCAVLSELSQEHPEWATPLRYARYILATRFKLTKAEKKWELEYKRPTRRKKKQ